MKKFIKNLAINLVVIGLFIPMFGVCLSNATEWDKAVPPGTTLINNIDTVLTGNNSALDRILADLRNGAQITYSSASALTVGAGRIGCSNSDGSVRKMRINTTSTSVTFSDIDTGAEASSTTYYVYAVCDAVADTFTVKISLSSTAPSGVTSYKKLGNFYNNASSNIAYIVNFDDLAYSDPSPSDLSEGTTWSAGVTYQNTTGHKLMVVWYGSGTRSGGWVEINQVGYIGETSAGTAVTSCAFSTSGSSYIDGCPGAFVVPEGWYWQITNSAGQSAGGSLTGSISRIETWEIN